ncbi:O-antigen polymerase [Pseudalkalibacillus decolorationis]|uniref:O-antigen polymerase n=1 Tax=Pseudalkalibacillus decolorationis TaxID=163879 RepID=UPI0021480C85|nr:O-antigen polymerase [Pseudalkalibacillus decolorationis]
MTKKKKFMLIFLVFYTMLISLIIVNSNDEKMLLSTYLIVLPAIIIYMAVYVKFFSATFFFLIFYLMLFFVQPIYNLLIEYHYYQYSAESIRTLTVLSVLGVLLFCIGNCISVSNNKVKLEKVYIENNGIQKVTILIGFVTLISVLLCIIDAGTLNIMNLSRLELKNSGSPFRLVANYGFYTTSIMFFGVFFTVKARRWSNVVKWLCIFVLLEILIFMLFRTRSLLVVHSASVLVGYYYSGLYGYNKNKNHLSPKVITLVLGVGLFLAAIISRFFRGYLQPGQSVGNFNFNLKFFLESSINSGDIGYSTTVLKVINYVPSYHDFLYGQSYYRLLFTVIPRSLWEGKPKNTQQIVASWLEPEIRGMSIPPGIIGDAYINFGTFGISILILFGIFFAILDRKLSIKYFMVWAVSATWIFHLVRGGFTNPIIIFTMLFIVITFINYKFFNKTNG